MSKESAWVVSGYIVFWLTVFICLSFFPGSPLPSDARDIFSALYDARLRRIAENYSLQEAEAHARVLTIGLVATVTSFMWLLWSDLLYSQKFRSMFSVPEARGIKGGLGSCLVGVGLSLLVIVTPFDAVPGENRNHAFEPGLVLNFFSLIGPMLFAMFFAGLVLLVCRIAGNGSFD